MKKSRKEKATTTPLDQEEKEDFETRNLFPSYIPPSRMDAPPVKIPRKRYVTLVAPKKLKGMKVLQDILL